MKDVYEDTYEDLYQYINEISSEKYLFSDYNFDIIYTLNDLSVNIYNDLLYIINIDYYNDVNIYDVLVFQEDDEVKMEVYTSASPTSFYCLALTEVIKLKFFR